MVTIRRRPKKLKVKVSDIITETHDTKTVKFDLAGQEFEYDAGHFVILLMDLPDLEGNTKKVQRSYSLSSSPTEAGKIAFTVKEMNEAFVSKLLVEETKVGDEFEIFGPSGLFTFVEGDSDNVVLIGAGSGIGPLRGMARYILDKKLPIKLTIIYSNKTPEDIIFHDELEQMEKEGMKTVLTVTRYDGDDWTRLKGRIDADMLKNNIEDMQGANYYLCGPEAFVDTMVGYLEGFGIDKKKQVKFEKFG